MLTISPFFPKYVISLHQCSPLNTEWITPMLNQSVVSSSALHAETETEFALNLQQCISEP